MKLTFRNKNGERLPLSPSRCSLWEISLKRWAREQTDKISFLAASLTSITLLSRARGRPHLPWASRGNAKELLSPEHQQHLLPDVGSWEELGCEPRAPSSHLFLRPWLSAWQPKPCPNSRFFTSQESGTRWTFLWASWIQGKWIPRVRESPPHSEK